MAIQICLYGMSIHGNGSVQFDVEVKREVGEELVAIPSGHRSVILDAAQLHAIAAKAVTNAAKLGQLAALIREDVSTWRVDESEDAANWLAVIAPSMSAENPVVFPLRV